MTISLKNHTLSYGSQQVLDAIDLHIHAGESVAIVGESGAGKSSLLAVLRQQQAGRAAWCPQDNALVPSLSAFHNIHAGALDQHNSLFNALNFFWPRQKAWQQVENVAKPLDIADLLNKRCSSLSGGQQQRVAIARALIQQCPVFLGDEPVSAVDEYQAEQILQLIIQRHETTVVALHHIDLALRCCQRIVGLQDGKIALDAPSAELKPADLAFLYPHERAR